MKKIIPLFILIFVALTVSCKPNLIALAIGEVVEKHFAKISERIDFVSFLKDNSQLVHTLKNSSVPYRVVNKKENETYKQQQSAIFMFDDFAAFWDFDRNHSRYTNYGPVVINNLVYCVNTSSKEIEETAKKYQVKEQPHASIFHQRAGTEELHMNSFLLQENGEIVLKALLMFTPQLCGFLQLVKINTFSQRRWTKNMFFTPEIINFNGCQLNFGVSSHRLPETHYKQPDGSDPSQPDLVFSYINGTTFMKTASEIMAFDTFEAENDKNYYAVDGYLIKLVEALASNLNFTFDYNPISTKTGYPEKTALIDLKLDAEICSDSVYSRTFPTGPTLHDFYSIIVPPGAQYSPLEKLFLPFDEYVWIIFVIIFLVAYFVLIFIRLFSHPMVAEFIFGENVKAPSLNIFLIFMGGGLIVLPKKNFPRFLIMSFILYCLIMRYEDFIEPQLLNKR